MKNPFERLVEKLHLRSRNLDPQQPEVDEFGRVIESAAPEQRRVVPLPCPPGVEGAEPPAQAAQSSTCRIRRTEQEGQPMKNCSSGEPHRRHPHAGGYCNGVADTVDLCLSRFLVEAAQAKLDEAEVHLDIALRNARQQGWS